MSWIDDILAKGSSLSEREQNWNATGMCACGHSHLSHHLKEPHRCNGAWVHPDNRKHPDAAFTDCDCSGFQAVAEA
jgi:hypothetical protein